MLFSTAVVVKTYPDRQYCKVILTNNRYDFRDLHHCFDLPQKNHLWCKEHYCNVDDTTAAE